MIKFFFFLGLTGLSFKLFSSALVHKDDHRRILTVKARIHYFGLEATYPLMAASTAEIENMWNAPAARVTLNNGIPYLIKFELDDALIGRRIAGVRESCAKNYVDVQKPVNLGRHSEFDICGSSGIFFTHDNIGFSTTAAHEFGHGLCLDHNPSDQRNAPVPGIMFARGTLVKPEFQWDPHAVPGQLGATINPVTRKVRKEDVAAIPFKKIFFNAQSLGCIGTGLPVAIR